MHGHLPDLWAAAAPSAAGVFLVTLLMVGGIAAVFVLMRGGKEDPDDVTRALQGIARARQRLREELERTEGALRAALLTMIEPPLRDLDARVSALVATARATAPRDDQGPERERIRALLAAEKDPRARALLEASLRDLDGTARSREALARSSRLALLELDRMRTLLDALPTRIHEVAVRRLEGATDAACVEAIAQEIELAVQTTGDVLDQV